MIFDKAVKQIKTIPLPAHRIARKIQDISRNNDDHLREYLTEKNELGNPWALEIDESIDISKKTQLISFLQTIRGGKIMSFFAVN